MCRDLIGVSVSDDGTTPLLFAVLTYLQVSLNLTDSDTKHANLAFFRL